MVQLAVYQQLTTFCFPTKVPPDFPTKVPPEKNTII